MSRDTHLVRTFRLEEILPDVAVEPVRLPRRQEGSSPQDATVTLLADYTLRSRAWLPSAAIVALLTESGVTAGSARTAISRLARRGVVESRRSGRRTAYRLTEPAAYGLAFGGREIVTFTEEAEAWDGQWTLIAFSLPQEDGARRRALRASLRWMGYMPLYDALWVSPRQLSAQEMMGLAAIGRGVFTVFRAWRIGLDVASGRDPIDAWSLGEVDKHYEVFMRMWGALLSRVDSGDITGPEAIRARTEVMDAYRRFVVLDPRLPMRLMPPGWLREQARDVFVSIYDGLAAPALHHVLDVIARTYGDPPLGVGTHTAAELGAGLRGGLD